MFNRKAFSDMRRSGMGVGVSKAKLSEAMLNVLLQLPIGSSNLKETIIAHLGLIGQMAATRDLNEAWTQTKKKAAKLYPDKLILDGRNNLTWNDGTITVIDKYISPANFKKLNELAIEKGCSVNAIIRASEKINYPKSHPLFRSSSPDLKSKNPRNRAAIPAVFRFQIERS